MDKNNPWVRSKDGALFHDDAIPPGDRLAQTDGALLARTDDKIHVFTREAEFRLRPGPKYHMHDTEDAHLTIDDILYSPIGQPTSDRQFDDIQIDTPPEPARPFADQPSSNAATNWLNNHLSHQNAQSQLSQQNLQHWQGLQQQSLQQQSLQQSLQQAIGYQQQNLQQYLNTTSASNAINPYVLAQSAVAGGTPVQMGGLSGSLNTSSSLSSPTVICPITGRQTISEAEAIRLLGAMYE